MRVLVNTSPLIALDQIGRLEILHALFGQVVRPQSVLDELRDGQHHLRRRPELLDAPWIITEPNPPAMALRREQGAGEAAVLVWGFQTPADLVILDDLQARLVATDLGLKLTGTLGVLLAAHQRGLIPDLAAVVRDLQSTGFHLSPALLRRFL